MANRNIVYGPGNNLTNRRTRQEEELRRSVEELNRSIDRIREKERVFDSKYGSPLGETARAYASSKRPGNYGWALLGRETLNTQDLLLLFSNELAKALSSQPEESRGGWLAEFLSELDRLVG